MTKIMMGRDEIQKVLQENGFTPNPAGLVDHVDGDQDEYHIWFDINADTVRQGDVVPDYPIRILYIQDFELKAAEMTNRKYDQSKHPNDF